MSETVNRQDRELVIALEIAVLFCPHLEVKGVVLEEELCWNSLCSVGQVWALLKANQALLLILKPLVSGGRGGKRCTWISSLRINCSVMHFRTSDNLCKFTSISVSKPFNLEIRTYSLSLSWWWRGRKKRVNAVSRCIPASLKRRHHFQLPVAPVCMWKNPVILLLVLMMSLTPLLFCFSYLRPPGVNYLLRCALAPVAFWISSDPLAVWRFRFIKEFVMAA